MEQSNTVQKNFRVDVDATRQNKGLPVPNDRDGEPGVSAPHRRKLADNTDPQFPAPNFVDQTDVLDIYAFIRSKGRYGHMPSIYPLEEEGDDPDSYCRMISDLDEYLSLSESKNVKPPPRNFPSPALCAHPYPPTSTGPKSAVNTKPLRSTAFSLNVPTYSWLACYDGPIENVIAVPWLVDWGFVPSSRFYLKIRVSEWTNLLGTYVLTVTYLSGGITTSSILTWVLPVASGKSITAYAELDAVDSSTWTISMLGPSGGNTWFYMDIAPITTAPLPVTLVGPGVSSSIWCSEIQAPVTPSIERCAYYVLATTRDNTEFIAGTMIDNASVVFRGPTLKVATEKLLTQVRLRFGPETIFTQSRGYAQWLADTHNSAMHTLNGNVERPPRRKRDYVPYPDQPISDEHMPTLTILSDINASLALPAPECDTTNGLIDELESTERVLDEIFESQIVAPGMILLLSISDNGDIDHWKALVRSALAELKAVLEDQEPKRDRDSLAAPAEPKRNKPRPTQREERHQSQEEDSPKKPPSEASRVNYIAALDRIVTRLRRNNFIAAGWFAATSSAPSYLQIVADKLWGWNWMLKQEFTIPQYIAYSRISLCSDWRAGVAYVTLKAIGKEEYTPAIVEMLFAENMESVNAAALLHNRTVHALTGNTNRNMVQVYARKNYKQHLKREPERDWDFSYHSFFKRLTTSGDPRISQIYDAAFFPLVQELTPGGAPQGYRNAMFPMTMAAKLGYYDEVSTWHDVPGQLRFVVGTPNVAIAPNLVRTDRSVNMRAVYSSDMATPIKRDQTDALGYNLNTVVQINSMESFEGLSLIVPLTKLTILHDVLLSKTVDANQQCLAGIAAVDGLSNIVGFNDIQFGTIDNKFDWRNVAGNYLFPVTPSTTGVLSFHLSFDTIPGPYDDIIIFDQMRFGVANAQRILSLYLAMFVEWPFTAMRVRTQETRRDGGGGVRNEWHALNHCSVALPGLRSIRVLISSRGAFLPPTTQQGADSTAWIQPMSGPTASVTLPANAPLPISWLNNISTGSLLDYIMSWADSWQMQDAVQLFSILSQITGINDDLQIARDLASVMVYKPLSPRTGDVPRAYPLNLATYFFTPSLHIDTVNNTTFFLGKPPADNVMSGTYDPAVAQFRPLPSMAVPRFETFQWLRVCLRLADVADSPPSQLHSMHSWIAESTAVHRAMYQSWKYVSTVSVFLARLGISGATLSACINDPNVPEDIKMMYEDWVSAYAETGKVSLSSTGSLLMALHHGLHGEEVPQFQVSSKFSASLYDFPTRKQMNFPARSDALTDDYRFLPTLTSTVSLAIWCESVPLSSSLMPCYTASDGGTTGFESSTVRYDTLFAAPGGTGLIDPEWTKLSYAPGDMPFLDDEHLWNQRMVTTSPTFLGVYSGGAVYIPPATTFVFPFNLTRFRDVAMPCPSTVQGVELMPYPSFATPNNIPLMIMGQPEVIRAAQKSTVPWVIDTILWNTPTGPVQILSTRIAPGTYASRLGFEQRSSALSVPSALKESSTSSPQEGAPIN